ncbi:uncharacterized protein VICG_01480 [Vittaforma corneae ATCC 50505]|uniref:RNA 3'-terminal phosphate cyclase domain-containing protein n=1 Tax=Vittaforma corneae (strain ATCC 50505) TaxID=993615 RepID=L2GKW3_VITCO|nr:uncharacterized protein VICG_01480 [Vittaforma corneae ATCC 50505]ELA41496.1 hypothetical protein VICG_01480 [Vittaforma corneae ATCC 50505]
MAVEITLVTDNSLEYALILSLLSRKPVCFTCALDVKSVPTFIKLLAPESTWKVSGDFLKFIPGPLEGGRHKLSVDRIPDALASIILLSPFLREDLQLEMSGITNHSSCSVDLFKITYYTMFRAFNLPRFDLSVKKRGFGPLGEGCVLYKTKVREKSRSNRYVQSRRHPKNQGPCDNIQNRIGLCS